MSETLRSTLLCPWWLCRPRPTAWSASQPHEPSDRGNASVSLARRPVNLGRALKNGVSVWGKSMSRASGREQFRMQEQFCVTTKVSLGVGGRRDNCEILTRLCDQDFSS
jgi:hypothetical protein